MSKLITTESLTSLRQEFKNYNELNNFLIKFQNDQFDFNSINYTEDDNYPVIDKSSLDLFYSKYNENQKDEFSLAKIIYESLPLDRVQASNNLFWLYLNLDPFFKYIKDRWIKKWEEDDKKQKDEIERFFLSIEPSQNSLIKSPIAGLWWAIHLTIDETLSDKYFYSKIFLSERNLRDKNIGSYQIIRDKKVMHAVLDFYHKYKDQAFEGKRIGSEAIAQQMIKTLNQLGGLTVLSYLSKEEIYQKLEQFKETIFNRARGIQIGKKVSRLKIEKQNNLLNSNNFMVAPKVPVKLKEKKSPVRIAKKEKVIKYFNLRGNGEYNLTDNLVNSFDFHASITSKNEYLLICYNESGYINRVKVSELLKKNRELYQNGIYEGNSVNDILVAKPKMIVGIIYFKDGEKFFKSFYTNKLKDNNGVVGLQGYKTMYESYDNIRYFLLPMDVESLIKRLIFKSFSASGKSFNNPNYKKEFQVINNLTNNISFELF
ncbi:DUF6339 family protein [Ochrovirga pacifica]|uniref:DUF6339 family protein n=1 Tax=Ochrovirga pacifica TaxID=1042376 RepID=UPI0002E5D298|nr:DUF6339 family protein [Ochrovirga pacifica]